MTGRRSFSLLPLLNGISSKNVMGASVQIFVHLQYISIDCVSRPLTFGKQSNGKNKIYISMMRVSMMRPVLIYLRGVTLIAEESIAIM